MLLIPQLGLNEVSVKKHRTLATSSVLKWVQRFFLSCHNSVGHFQLTKLVADFLQLTQIVQFFILIIQQILNRLTRKTMWKTISELIFHFTENGYCIKDSKKYPGQTLTPRHTIDAILGLNDRCDSDNIGGECWKSISLCKPFKVKCKLRGERKKAKTVASN